MTLNTNCMDELIKNTEKNKSTDIKKCEWCDKPLPIKYHLRICPDCRKASVSDFLKKYGSENISKNLY